METCTPRPNISIRSAHSVPNLHFEVNRTYESSLKKTEAILIECEEIDIDVGCSKLHGYDLNTSNNNLISPQEIEIVIPLNDNCSDLFQRNTVRKSRKRYRAPPPPASVSQNVLPNSMYTRNRNPSLDVLIKSESPYSDINIEQSINEGDTSESGLGNRTDDVRMSVLQRKAILEKQLKLRVIPIGEPKSKFQASNLKSNGLEPKHLINNDSRIEFEEEQTTKAINIQKEVKRSFIPPPPPPPKIPPVIQSTNHPRQQNELHTSNGAHSDGKDDKNGCDTCVDWVLFLLCIA